MNKPIDQELLPCPFCGGKPTVSNFPGAHNIWCSNQPAKCGNRSMYKVDEWQARASVQPAGVAVPTLTESEREDLIEFYQAVCCDAGHRVEKSGMQRLAAIGAVESVGFGKHRLTEFGSALLAAAPHPASPENQPNCDFAQVAVSVVPHPVSGEQKPVHWRAVLHADQRPQQLHDKHVVGFPTSEAAEAWVAEKKHFQGWDYSIEPLYAAPPAAQDVAGLVKVLADARQVLATALQSSAPDWFKTEADIASHHTIERMDAAIAAQRAQRAQNGAQKPSPAFVVSLPVPVKSEQPDWATDDSWMDDYNVRVRVLAECALAIEAAGGQVVRGNQP